MSGKAKSVHLTVADSKTHKAVFRKTFMNATEYNAFMKSEKFLEQYPKPVFYYVKEVY